MMDINDVARRALTRPQIYVPALVDEIMRLQSELEKAQSEFQTILTMCKTHGLWAVENHVTNLVIK